MACLARLERQERRQNIIGGLFTVLCALAGFVFWPMMVWWTSGVDLTAEMVDASAGFNMMVVGIMLATSVLFGFVGLAIAKRD